MLEKIFLLVVILLPTTTNAKLRIRTPDKMRVGGICDAEWCDPSHEPYPNIVSVMTGYDIIKGNPFPSDERNDPGFSTSYIFVPTYKTTDGRYALHGGISVRQTTQCSLTLDTSFISTVKEYIDTISNKASKNYGFTSNLETEVSVEVKGVGIKTTVPPLLDAAFGSSSEESEGQSFFTSTQGILSLTDATCTTYSVHMSAYNPPPFTEAMVKALHQLNGVLTKSPPSRKQEVLMFIHQFGTHFLEQVTMGARLSMTRKYSRKEYTESNIQTIKECNKKSFHANIFGVQLSAATQSCMHVSNTANTDTVEGFKRLHIVSYGSRPAANMVEWSRQKFDAPLPIQMHLSPIINIFTRAHFVGRHDDINYKGILRMMAPFYYNYCGDGHLAFGLGKCSINDQKGCGWNDKCIRNQEVCVNKPSDKAGYTCCKPQCALLKPCQHGGSCRDIITSSSCSYRCTCKSGYNGTQCTDRIAVGNEIEKEVRNQMKYHQSYDHASFSNYMVKLFASQYPLYWFTAVSYNEVSGFDKHTISCHACVHVFREYGRNFVMGWARRSSRIPQPDMRNHIMNTTIADHNQGCDALKNNGIAWQRINQFGFPVSFVFTCKYSGTKCLPAGYGNGYWFGKKYRCGTYKKGWTKRKPDYTYLYTMFGSA